MTASSLPKKKKGVTSRDRSVLFLIVSFSCSLLGCLNLNDTDQVVAWHKKLRSVILWRPVFWIFCFVLFCFWVNFYFKLIHISCPKRQNSL